MTRDQLDDFASPFGSENRARYDDSSRREKQGATIHGIAMTSDGYLPFRDNVEHAAEYGVTTIVEPGRIRAHTRGLPLRKERQKALQFTGVSLHGRAAHGIRRLRDS